MICIRPMAPHGFLADTPEAAVEAFFGPYAEVTSRIGRERGWPPLSRAGFDQGRGQRGHLMVGTPDEAIAKILAQHEVFRHDRTLMQMSVGAQPQDAILRSIELLGTVVVPKVRAELLKVSANNSIELGFVTRSTARR
jgi:alkanesulfonate monooxygenase SsuD/methylene tetrahydromethanopterin reductase-like flavin-dependent oxidoreductase (luciferase family)